MDPAGRQPRDAEVEARLRGPVASSLADLLGGAEAVRELVDLARAADAAGAGGERVIIVPGVMGSTLGLRGPLWDDVIWLDLVDIALGRLAWLALDRGDQRVEPLGVILPAYLPLKLRLRLAGFDAVLHPWDWRAGLGVGADALSRAVHRAPGRVHLVGHSMGGLVAQAVLALGPDAVRRRLGRVVTLGTPSWGAPAAATVLQGTHPAIARLAAVHPDHDPRVLARAVFGSFPSSHLLLPWRERWTGPDLDQEATWSAAWPAPRVELLARARREQAELAVARPSVAGQVAQVVGVDRPTVVGLVPGPGPDEPFGTVTSLDGDGTVPRALAEVDGAGAWYATASHGALPRDRTVMEAVVDLLREGSTARLPTSWSPPLVAPLTASVAPSAGPGPATTRWSWRELRRLVQEFVGETEAERPAPPPAPVG